MNCIRIAITIDLTMMCNRMCWFCDSGAGPTGCHLPLQQLLSFFSDLRKVVAEGKIEVVSIHFTGGGEPLMFPWLVKVIRAAKKCSYHVSMHTSGPENYWEERRFRGACRLLESVDFSFDPESERSYKRLSRAVRGRLCKETLILCRVAPDQGNDFERELVVKVSRLFGRKGYHFVQEEVVLLIAPEVAVEMPLLRIGFERGRQFVTIAPSTVSPAGKALHRLQSFTQTLELNDACRLGQKELAHVHIMQGGLSHCCDCRAKPLHPMTMDGMSALLEAQKTDGVLVQAAFEANSGKEVHDRCEICPIFGRCTDLPGNEEKSA